MALENNPQQYLKYLKYTRNYEQKTIHNIAEYIVRTYNDSNKLYDITMQTFNNLLNITFIQPISTIIIEYTNEFGITHIKKTIQLYLNCIDNNLSDIILTSLFPRNNIDLKLPELKITPKKSVFNGTNMVLYVDRKLKYMSHNVVCIIYFDRPDNWSVYCDVANYEYHVLVITQNDTIIKAYTVNEDVFFQSYRKPIHVDGAFYSYIENALALDFEYSIYEN